MIEKILKQFHWDRWLKRPYFGFYLSLLQQGALKKTFDSEGLDGWEQTAFIISNGFFYHSSEIDSHMVPTVEKWLKSNSISTLCDRLDSLYVENREKIIDMATNPAINTFKKFAEIIQVCARVAMYGWGVHMIEPVLSSQLEEKTIKYIHKDIDKFIRRASRPVRLNALQLMENEIRSKVKVDEIVKKYAWMKSRDGFSPPYTKKEIQEYASGLKKQTKYIYPIIPHPLKKIFSEAQSLVYLRTKRADVFHEFLFLARPIFNAVADHYSIPREEIKYYDAFSLLTGKLVKFPKKFTYMVYKNKSYLSTDIFDVFPSISKEKKKNIQEIKGIAAKGGVYTGRVKILLSPLKMNKVKKGDILVTNMTSADFLPAMRLASAFITDEGGLTCHAAIISREMNKPCIIGAKNASLVLRDGDKIEVDADNGVIRILTRNRKHNR